MPFDESKYVSPSARITPSSGCSAPTIAESVSVFPEPEGPHSTVTSAASSSFGAMRNAPARARTSTSSLTRPAPRWPPA
jgi:hypothetical protein